MTLGSGLPLTIRPLSAADVPRVARMLGRLTPESAYRRFFSPLPHLDDQFLSLFCRNDADHEVYVAAVGDEVVGIAHGTLADTAADAVDVAVVVDDGWQRRGVATRLLRSVAGAARAHGAAALTATMLADNRPVLELARALAPIAAHERDGSEINLRVPLAA